MNFKHIKTLIAFSLVAAIAQPMQAATYKDRAKKIGRYAWHASKIASGTFLGAAYLTMILDEVQFILSIRGARSLFLDGLIIKSTTGIPLPIAAFIALKSGYDGLKAEWAKN